LVDRRERGGQTNLERKGKGRKIKGKGSTDIEMCGCLKGSEIAHYGDVIRQPSQQAASEGL